MHYRDGRLRAVPKADEAIEILLQQPAPSRDSGGLRGRIVLEIESSAKARPVPCTTIACTAASLSMTSSAFSTSAIIRRLIAFKRSGPL